MPLTPRGSPVPRMLRGPRALPTALPSDVAVAEPALIPVLELHPQRNLVSKIAQGVLEGAVSGILTMGSGVAQALYSGFELAKEIGSARSGLATSLSSALANLGGWWPEILRTKRLLEGSPYSESETAQLRRLLASRPGPRGPGSTRTLPAPRTAEEILARGRADVQLSLAQRGASKELPIQILGPGYFAGARRRGHATTVGILPSAAAISGIPALVESAREWVTRALEKSFPTIFPAAVAAATAPGSTIGGGAGTYLPPFQKRS